MNEPLVFVFTLRIKEGKLGDLKRYLEDINAFVEVNEPRILAYTQFIDDGGTEMTDIQIHPDAASMEFHMNVAGHKIAEAFNYVETRRVDVCGSLSQALLEQMKQVAGSGVLVSIKSPLGGFTRLQSASR